MPISFHLIVIGILVAGWGELSLAACAVGKWGKDCQQTCAEGCLFSMGCEEVNGVCNTCNDGFYGPRCDSKCSDNCQECFKETGLCHKCENSWYGELCDKRCPENCYGCSKTDGRCSHCKNGYWGETCENECQPNTACARNCVTGASSSLCENACKCNFCTQSDGICEQCVAGFWGNGCDRTCPEHCIIDCYFESGNCRGLLDQINGVRLYCKDGYWGSKCQYSCQTQNCSRCDQSGHCIQCKDGKWGKFCDNKCDHCSACDVSHGYCTTCSPGYWGYKCDQRCAIGCSCCNIRSGFCDMSACRLENLNLRGSATQYRNDSMVPKQDSEDEPASTISVVGIATLVVGCVLCAACIAMMVCLIRRRQDGKSKSIELKTTYVSDGYLRPVHRNASVVYDSPEY